MSSQAGEPNTDNVQGRYTSIVPAVAAGGPVRCELVADASQQRPVVIVVDDDGALCRPLATALRASGLCNALAYTDPRRALQEVAAVRPRAAILDVDMPAMDGITLARALRSVDPSLPILFLTGAPAEIDARALERELGPVVRMQPKPSSTKVVARWLRRQLKSSDD